MTINYGSWTVTRHRPGVQSYGHPAAVQTPEPQDPYTLPRPQDPYIDDVFSQQTVGNSPYGQGLAAPPTWPDDPQLDHTLVDGGYVNDRYAREDQPIWYGSAEGTVTAAVARQRRRYGGVKVGSTLFGLLTAVSMALLLVALAAAAVAGFTGGASAESFTGMVDANLTGMSIGAAVALLLIVIIAFFSGGYVAARMARFSGAAHGVAVWVGAVGVTTLSTWVAAGQVGRYSLASLVEALNAGSVQALPKVSISQDFLARVCLVAAAILALTALAAAVLGGAVGDRYHRRIDRAAGPWFPGSHPPRRDRL